MPFVDFHSKVDYAAIFYTTNTPFMNVSSFDPEKPSVVILHPAFLDLSWVDLQLGDSRLDSNYNIIAFDSRTSGKSNCRLSGRHDSWVDAADLAFCFQVRSPICTVATTQHLSRNSTFHHATFWLWKLPLSIAPFDLQFCKCGMHYLMDCPTDL